MINAQNTALTGHEDPSLCVQRATVTGTLMRNLVHIHIWNLIIRIASSYMRKHIFRKADDPLV